jgi:hypothetical protein
MARRTTRAIKRRNKRLSRRSRSRRVRRRAQRGGSNGSTAIPYGALVTGRLSNDTDSVPTLMSKDFFMAERGANPDEPATEGDGT